MESDFRMDILNRTFWCFENSIYEITCRNSSDKGGYEYKLVFQDEDVQDCKIDSHVDYCVLGGSGPGLLVAKRNKRGENVKFTQSFDVLKSENGIVSRVSSFP